MSEVTSSNELLDSTEEARYILLVEVLTKDRGRLGITFEWEGGTMNVSHIPRERYLSEGIDPDMSAPTWGMVFRKTEMLEQDESSVLIKYTENEFYFEEGGHLGGLLDSYHRRYDTQTGEELPEPEEYPAASLFAAFHRAVEVEDRRRPVKKGEFYHQLVPALEHAIMLDDTQLLDIEESE